MKGEETLPLNSQLSTLNQPRVPLRDFYFHRLGFPMRHWSEHWEDGVKACPGR